MSDVCDICGGVGFIILPTKPHLRAGPGVFVFPGDHKPVAAGVDTKKFGCPQCNPTVGGDPIKILKHSQSIRADLNALARDRVVEFSKHAAASAMAETLLRDGCIEFTEREFEGVFPGEVETHLVAELRVVSPQAMARVKEWRRK